MAAIDDLIDQIDDEALRERLRSETKRITEDKKFGLIFEPHLPERTPIYSAKVRSGNLVMLKNKKRSFSDLWTVISVNEENATCINIQNGKEEVFIDKELVVVTQFGEPVFPTLVPAGRVQNGQADFWHTLIEADNYHALQLLEYLYTGKVDCIYIDPPYNTGAKDWKYNNDYVDEKDRWRHSKWLAFMQRRLKIAKRLLTNDGVLITAIDDNEYAHLWMLLQDIFPNYEHIPVTMQHNPGGTQGDNFSVTHEYVIFSLAKDAKIFKKAHTGGDTYNLRRWGSTSGRFEGATCFYPIILDADYNVIEFGEIPDDNFNPTSQTIRRDDGTYEVWPIDKENIEKKWRYARDTVESVKSRMFVVPQGDRIEIKLRREDEQPKTVWTDRLYNAEAHGTTLITKILGGGFSYPKSIYAVRDAITCAVSGKKNAIILDFFAGSGTTLNAVNLINETDGGKRRCIIVTNNEVSEGEVKRLTREGYFQGDMEWERHGICQSITWPRSKYTIQGKRDDGTELEGEYSTGKFVEKEKARKFFQIGFTSIDELNTLTKKKQLVALLGKEKLPQSAVKRDSDFVVTEKYPASILFDVSKIEEWLKELEGQEHIVEFYIVTDRKAIFDNIKGQVEELLGNIIFQEEYMLPLREGFNANLEYFKLDFLDKDDVALGQQFREILPILWLEAGAIGPRPEVSEDEQVPKMLIPENNAFAVLIDENEFADFNLALKTKENITHVYLVTDSEDAFHEMSEQLNAPKVIQLYRNYLENFAINRRGE
ncbi:site-specific DNA-methyltransferase [Bacillus atrophaeus]|uniref:site-specific DNA-methyltransferase n=1 Tax=Bacillus atrophaeus TaxID=1452 RepID=UPI00227EA981|nr:site-specific DNA-methyltransferase [Bacillus atrophaeus]MCY8961770.1 site-specific DNA-methyltransferase [Bacillus atrophaeus]MCY8965127.1 site-specific DNA-methyltransferase [Bacillus atrophaeus]MCY9439878.1 site-specific DNA-methyltransferase [Bacillus atrophaeus]MEC0652070.1 site-specific DNA-methyltransferase [Bacillus atrophaeus]